MKTLFINNIIKERKEMTSGLYQLSAETIRNQTNLGCFNIFEKVKCSCCRQLGHNYLFCPVFDTPKLFGVIINEIIKLNTDNDINRLLIFIELFETKILRRLALYLDIQSKTRNGMKRNIYLKIKELLFDQRNILLPCLPNHYMGFQEPPLILGPRNTFPNNNVPVYNFDIYYSSPTYNVLGCYQYASNILLKYGNRFTDDPNISLELFTNLLFIDILKFTYQSDNSVLSSMIDITYNEDNIPIHYGHTMSHFRVLVNCGIVYPHRDLPSYFHPSSRIEVLILTTGNILRQRFRLSIPIEEQLPIQHKLPIECKISNTEYAEPKTIYEKKTLFAKLEPKASTSNLAEPKENKKITKEEIECEIEEETKIECPICYNLIHECNKIGINSCHIYCIDCIKTYLHTNQFKTLTCALCRDNIHTFLSREENIKLLKSQFKFK